MKKIVVTTDLSVNSKAGIKFALQLQSQIKCELVFYYVVEIMAPNIEEGNFFKVLEKEKTAEYTKKLSAFITTLIKGSTSTRRKIQLQVELSESVDQSVLAYAKKIKANYICMSTHGAGKLSKMFGTTASRLINYSPLPLLIIPHTYKVKVIKDLFYASDLARLTKEIKIVKEFAGELKTKTKVLHYDYLLNEPDNRKKLEKLADKFRSKDLQFQFRYLDIEHSLSENLSIDIKKEKPGLIVLFTKPNLNWFNRLFPSGEARELAFNSKIPLLIYRKSVES